MCWCRGYESGNKIAENVGVSNKPHVMIPLATAGPRMRPHPMHLRAADDKRCGRQASRGARLCGVTWYSERRSEQTSHRVVLETPTVSFSLLANWPRAGRSFTKQFSNFPILGSTQCHRSRFSRIVRIKPTFVNQLIINLTMSIE